MNVTVQKFGGSSLKTAADRDRVARWIQRGLDHGEQPVVVVSAMGRRGDPYATDTLLHLLEGVAEMPPRDVDMLLACGEIISVVLMSAHLRRLGINAVPMTGGDAGIVTDANHGDARILEVVPDPITRVLQEHRIPVVAGFQGRTREGAVTTIGRGGSDTTAVALGAALRAPVDIFTDVDGVMTADPRLVPDARTIAQMDYEEVFQLANLGARVIHPRAVEIARQFGVAVRVRSTFSESEGTLIAARTDIVDSWGHRDASHAITGITQLVGLTRFAVTLPDTLQDKGWASTLFGALGAVGISVDFINVFPRQAFFSVPAARSGATEAILQRLGHPYQMEPARAKVSVVGSAMRGLPGVMGRVMEGCSQVGVEVLQTVDSHSTISVLVAEADVERAVRGLHDQFLVEMAPQ